MIGAIIFPKTSPNLTQSLFNGERRFEFNKPRTKKIIPSEIDQIRISFSFSKGHKPIIKKTIKKRIPKLLLDDLLCIICNIPINLKLNITLISFK